jgi:hypothetical protein
MIAASPKPPVAYLWEPFSVLHRPGICRARFPYWFPYVCAENEQPYLAPITDMLDFRYGTAAELRSVRSVKDAGRLIRDRRGFHRYRAQSARPLLKDPIAVFSAEWLSDTFAMDVLVLIRHPAAFANSVKMRRLRHPFGDFLAQPLLMRDLLSPFEEEIRGFTSHERPLLDQAILLWKLIHHAIAEFRHRRPEWLFLRLEDLASDPMSRFEDIYIRLGQELDVRARAIILEHSRSTNAAESPDPADHRRDSRASIETWKSRLTGEEIEKIRREVEPLSKEFYSDVDW